jgi:hypothetical protein
MARSRESLWLWVGASLVAAAVALGGAAVALDAVRAGYRLWSSDPMIAAYAITALAGASFWALSAIGGSRSPLIVPVPCLLLAQPPAN